MDAPDYYGMRKLITFLAAAFLASPATTCWGEPIAFYGLTLLDPIREQRTPNAFVIVEGKKIVRVGSGRPPASIPPERTHDYSGHFAMPGLFDTHAHLTLGPVSLITVDGKPALQSAGDDAITKHDALMLLAHGITTVRDPGGDTTRTLAYRRAQAAGEILGPEAKVAGLVIERSPVPFRGLLELASDTTSPASIVTRQAAAGVDYVKLYQSLTAEELQGGIDAAHKGGVEAIAHLGDVSWTTAARLGIDALVHAVPQSPDLLPPAQRSQYLERRRPGSFAFFEWYELADLDAPQMREAIAILAKERVWLDGTLITFQLAFHGNDLAFRDRDAAVAHPAMLANWRGNFRFDLGWKDEDYRRAQAVWPKVLRLTRMLYEAGVPLTIGTDMNNPFVAPGASVAREMQLHVDAGIDNWAVLRMATSDAARLMHIEKRTGRLAAGMEADMLILEADPARDMSAVSQVAAVVHDGQLLNPETLKAQAKQ
jgi:imidazolonepropionase-like amidohydrolase